MTMTLARELSPPADARAELARLLDGSYPDANGRYGPFGGRFVPETLMPAITRLEKAAREAFADRRSWTTRGGRAGSGGRRRCAAELSREWG